MATSNMALESTIAGSWYPGTEREIRALAEKWEGRLGRETAACPEKPNVLVLPHAGWEYSGEIAWRAARLVRGAGHCDLLAKLGSVRFREIASGLLGI